MDSNHFSWICSIGWTRTTDSCFYQLNYYRVWFAVYSVFSPVHIPYLPEHQVFTSEWRDLNPQPQHPKCRVLPIALHPVDGPFIIFSCRFPVMYNCTQSGATWHRGSGWTWTTSPKEERFYRPCGYQLPVTLPLLCRSRRTRTFDSMLIHDALPPHT